ncbi:unnamed protein product [Candidula unifasciata]|uniref:Ankyrin repeat protein n=1 Tax=Candidula unifasciata TaxID=100452 RepID=A0A8S3ZUM5_9EUPU|nr:unnamed protein product [Candidula unifasciata]
MGQQLDKPSRIATAASEGHVKHVRRSVSSAGSIDVRNDDGRSALMLAVEHRHAVAVRTLLEAGADVNTKELSHTSGRSVLMLAIEEGATECAKLFIQAKADVNSKDTSGQTSLMYAVKKDNIECLQALVKAGANLNQGDSLGITPLMLAVKMRHYKCLELLLHAGADPNIADSTGQTCLMHAVKEATPNSVKCLQILLQPRPTAKVKVDVGDNNGMTALMHCVRNGNLECLRELLRARANPDGRDILGRTALMLAAEPQSLKVDEELQHDFVNDLIDAGANLNIRDYEGNTALMRAVEENLQSPIANILRARGADVNVPDKSGLTVLMLAIRKMDNAVFLKFLHELIENDVNLDAVDKWGKTALIHAIELKESVHEKAVCLLQMGANPHTGRHLKIRLSPLIACALHKNFEKTAAPERVSFMKFFIASGFQTDFDTAYRPGSDNIANELDDGARSLLHKLYSNPWPLARLALIAVSTAIGPNPGRDKRVKKTHLPQRIQNLLLFQDPISRLPRHHWDSIPLCFNPRDYETLPKPRPLLLYWPIGRELVKCYCKKCQGRGLNFHGV